jgi:DNA-binding NtrC family response regulator
MTSHNNILWTALDFTLPETLWKRLEKSGYRVLIMDNEDNLLDKIKSLSPRLWAGQINGDSEASLVRLQDIKSNFPGLPVVLMSRNPDIEIAVRAIKLGAFDFLGRNISNERLWAVLEGALRNPFPLSRPQVRKYTSSTAHPQPIAVHPSMRKILDMAKKIAPSRSTVLLNGETGVGKEVLARFIHNNSDRKDGPFIAVNCAALPENLLESELFGHEKGAFTGAVSRKKGKFELANRGTILLDEISEMAVSIQSKLLRVLQEREIDRIGGQYSIPLDTRVIATTNRNLHEETKKGNFRLDLFYRLNVVPLEVPPLRERPCDIAPLSEFFLKKHCTLNNMPIKSISRDAEELLQRMAWPGNVREFENLIERSTLLVESDEIGSEDIRRIYNPDLKPDFQELEKKMIFMALDNHEGNRTHAARVLGISVRTLRNKIHEYEMAESAAT